jgi:hypothetical protein
VQTCLDERMIEHAVLFAAGHIGEASQICQHCPGAILPVEPQQGTRLRKLVRGEVARDRRKSLAQLRAVATVPSITKRAEPLEAVGLTDDSPRPDHLPPLAPPVARSTHLIQPAKSQGQVFALRQRARARGLTRAIDIKDHPRLSRSIHQPTRLLVIRVVGVGREWAAEQIIKKVDRVWPVIWALIEVESGRLSRSSRKSVRRASTGDSVSAAKKRERVERAGRWSRSNKAMKGTAKGWSLS